MTKVNFQINSFSKIKRNKFKSWAHKNRLSMRALQYIFIDNEERFQPLIEEIIKEGEIN